MKANTPLFKIYIPPFLTSTLVLHTISVATLNADKPKARIEKGVCNFYIDWSSRLVCIKFRDRNCVIGDKTREKHEKLIRIDSTSESVEGRLEVARV